MNSVIVCSLNDPAGTNIRERLIESHGFRETGELFDSYPVYSLDSKIKIACSHKDIVFVDDVESHFGEAEYYFISRHRAESGVPSLTAHIPGNFGPNLFGGKPKEIATYSPSMLKKYFIELSSLRGQVSEQYSFTLEATHHGPTSLHSPSMFVELGSTPDRWVDTETAGFVAQALISGISKREKYEKCAIGIGGTHYPEKFGKMLLGSEIAFGPIVPKYSLENFDEAMLRQILEKSVEPIKFAAIDLKGLGQFKQKVTSVLDLFPLEQIRA